MYCTHYTVQHYILYTLHCTHYTVQHYILYTLHCTHYTVQHYILYCTWKVAVGISVMFFGVSCRASNT